MAQAVIWQVPNLAQAVVDSTAGTLTYQTYDTSSSEWVTQWTMNLSSGDITVAQSVTANGFNPSPTKNSLAGTTAGIVYYVQPFIGSTYKEALFYFDGYENDTTTNQTIAFPAAFSTVAGVTSNTSGLTLLASVTELTITTPDATTAYTGLATVRGW